MHNLMEVNYKSGGQMQVQINLVAVLLAAAAGTLVSLLWYNTSVFGASWNKLTGLSEKKQAKAATQEIIVAAIAALIAACVMAQVTFLANRFFSTSYEFWMTDALQTAFWLWLGIAATTIVTNNAFEQKRAKLTALAVGNQFAILMTIGLVLGMFKPV